MYTTRQPTLGFSYGLPNYNENYFTTRKKILNDFMKDEESENLKYIEETESLVSQTKLFLKDLLSGTVDFDILNDQLEDIQNELESDCNLMKSEISTLKSMDENIEKQISNLQKEEDLGNKDYMKKIETLKNDLESKEFTIQNMERLYIELEDVIKENIQKGNEQLLTMEQFSDFLSQNIRLKNDIKKLEEEKIRMNDEYNKVLKENVNLRKNDEEYEEKKIKEIMEEFEKEGKNSKNTKDDAMKKINEFKKKQQKLNDEYEMIKNKINKLLNKLKGINLENANFDRHLIMIEKELIEMDFPRKKKRNKSFSYYAHASHKIKNKNNQWSNANNDNNINIISTNVNSNVNNDPNRDNDNFIRKEMERFCPWIFEKK